MDRKPVRIMLAFAVLVIAALACDSVSNTGTKIGAVDTPSPPPVVTVAQAQATASPKPTAVPVQPTIQIYKVGDIIRVLDHTIVLNSAGIQVNILKANFTIQSTGAKDVIVSSLSFSAKDTDGVRLQQKIFDCGTLFSGKVLPGDKLRGDICWDGARKTPIRIQYEANLFGSGAVVWEIIK